VARRVTLPHAHRSGRAKATTPAGTASLPAQSSGTSGAPRSAGSARRSDAARRKSVSVDVALSDCAAAFTIV
jgi:hypothetical protein